MIGATKRRLVRLVLSGRTLPFPPFPSLLQDFLICCFYGPPAYMQDSKQRFTKIVQDGSGQFRSHMVSVLPFESQLSLSFFFGSATRDHCAPKRPRIDQVLIPDAGIKHIMGDYKVVTMFINFLLGSMMINGHNFLLGSI